MRLILMIFVVAGLSSCDRDRGCETIQNENMELKKLITDLEIKNVEYEDKLKQLEKFRSDFDSIATDAVSNNDGWIEPPLSIREIIDSSSSTVVTETIDGPYMDESDIYYYNVVEVKPEFPGGEEKMFKYLGDNFKYPKHIITDGLLDKFYYEFIIEKDGTTSNHNLLRGNNARLAEAYLNVLKSMPKWTVGEHEGKKVRVRFILPITTHIQ